MCYGTFKKSFKQIVDESNKIHNNKYTYIESTFISHDSHLTIICSEHGPFKQRPKDHINSRQGCPKCAYARTGWTKTKFINLCKINNNRAWNILYY